MIKIVEIKKLKKNYQLTFDDDTTLVVDEDTIVKYRLFPGREIFDMSLLTESIETNKLYDKAARFASFGKSENQMVSYLNDLGIDDTTEMIFKLKKDHFINDYKMINALKKKGYSYLKLEEKLRYYQFDDEDISNALSDYDEYPSLLKEYKLALKKYSKEIGQKKPEKIYRYLLSKGFNEYSVSSIMKIN